MSEVKFNLTDAEKDILIQRATSIMQHAGMKSGETESAMRLLEKIPGWRNADALLATCREQIAQTERLEKEERETVQREMHLEHVQKERRRKVTIVLCALAAAALVFGALKLAGVF